MIWPFSNHKYTHKKLNIQLKCSNFYFMGKCYTLLSSVSLRAFNCFPGLVDLKREAEKRVALKLKSASGFPRFWAIDAVTGNSWWWDEIVELQEVRLIIPNHLILYLRLKWFISFDDFLKQKAMIGRLKDWWLVINKTELKMEREKKLTQILFMSLVWFGFF